VKCQVTKKPKCVTRRRLRRRLRMAMA
jgi:hypothetical protein